MDLPVSIELPTDFLDEEIRCNYKVTTSTKKIWAVELDLLNELIKLCKDNGLKIYADGGTMLGAIRHDGFIPWDDDIDVVMFRDDYEKLCSVASDYFKYPYFFQTEYTDPGSLRGHAQLRNSLTTGILDSELNRNNIFNQGIFIDIFPLDRIPDGLARKKFFYQLKLFKKFLHYYNKINLLDINNSTRIKSLVAYAFHPFTSDKAEKSFFKLFEKLEKKYNKKECNSVSKLFFPEVKENMIWKEEWFEETFEHKFETITIPVSKEYNKILSKFFGDWKTPIKSESSHGKVIFDVNVSYKEYLTSKEGINR